MGNLYIFKNETFVLYHETHLKKIWIWMVLSILLVMKNSCIAKHNYPFWIIGISKSVIVSTVYPKRTNWRSTITLSLPIFIVLSMSTSANSFNLSNVTYEKEKIHICKYLKDKYLFIIIKFHGENISLYKISLLQKLAKLLSSLIKI